MLAATVVSRPAAGESPPVTHITHISVEHRDGDSTVIAVSFDGPITGHRWSHIGGEEPRAVVSIAGIVEAYRPYEVAVEDGRVRRIRIGHHPEFNPPEEHLVFDLIDDRVAITRVMKQDQRLIVVLRKVEASDGSRSQAPGAPTPTALVLKTFPATPTNPPQVAAPDRQVATIPHPPKDFSGPLLTELVISHREDGSALVRISADGPIEGSDVRFFGVRVAPPRNLLVIPGAGLPGKDALLSVRDGLLCEIGVVFTKDGGPARTELTFYLASSEVTFEQAGVKGAHAVIHLRPPANPQASLACEVENRMRSRNWHFIATGPPQEAPIGAK